MMRSFDVESPGTKRTVKFLKSDKTINLGYKFVSYLSYIVNMDYIVQVDMLLH